MIAKIIAQLYANNVIEASKLAKAASVTRTSISDILTEIELLGIPRNVVFGEAVKPSTISKNEWRPYSLEEAVEVLYSGKSVDELASKFGRSKKSIENFRWRAFRQGFLVSKSLLNAVNSGASFGWRGSFLRTLAELESYALNNGLTPPKIIYTD